MAFDRAAPFSMKIEDPDNPNEKSKLGSMIGSGGSIYMFNENCTFKATTAESLDPDNHYPDTKHSYEKVYDIGAKSTLISLVTLQAKDLLQGVSFTQEKKDEIISHIWIANEKLISCYNSCKYLDDEFNRLSSKCDKVIEDNKHKGYIPPLPKIKQFENNVNTFFNSGKLFIIELFELLNIILDKPLNRREAAHLKKHLQWVESKFGKDNELYKLIKEDKEWIQFLFEIRNAIEHSEPGQKVSFKNISLHPGNKFAQPLYSYNLLKKQAFFDDMELVKDNVDLIKDMSVSIHNMQNFANDFIAFVINNKMRENGMLEVYRIPEDSIKEECPMTYTYAPTKKFSKIIKDNK